MTIELMVEVTCPSNNRTLLVPRVPRGWAVEADASIILPVAEDPRTTPMCRLRVRKGLDGP